jgi:hypothetical protein
VAVYGLIEDRNEKHSDNNTKGVGAQRNGLQRPPRSTAVQQNSLMERRLVQTTAAPNQRKLTETVVESTDLHGLPAGFDG